VHFALPVSLSLHVQKCELNRSEKNCEKHAVKLFHLNYSAPIYRALATAAGNVMCADFCNPFRQHQLGLEKQKIKCFLFPPDSFSTSLL